MAGIVEAKIRWERFKRSIVGYKKYAVGLVYTCCALFLLWIIISFIEVNMHNLTDHIYSDWNFFTNFLEWFYGVEYWREI